jgi:hypothetical protein
MNNQAWGPNLTHLPTAKYGQLAIWIHYHDGLAYEGSL